MTIVFECKELMGESLLRIKENLSEFSIVIEVTNVSRTNVERKNVGCTDIAVTIVFESKVLIQQIFVQ